MCRQQILYSDKICTGTGFVGKVSNEEMQLLITCNDVIDDENTAKSSLFMFNRIDDQFEVQQIKGENIFDIKASKWFWNDKVSFSENLFY